MLMKKYAIIVAGGSGSRMKSEIPKQFLPLGGKPVLLHTLEAFESAGNIEIILVLPAFQIQTWRNIVSEKGLSAAYRIVEGGETRFHSVRNGLATIPETDALVAVHDGVRPLVTPALISRCYDAASRFGAAVTAVSLKDSIRKLITGDSSCPADREQFRLVQTPQAFRVSWMKSAFERPYKSSYTDCASVIEDAGYQVQLIEGDYRNIKITTPEDLIVAEALIKAGSEYQSATRK